MFRVAVDVEPVDPLRYSGVALVLALVALAATYLPARRSAIPSRRCDTSDPAASAAAGLLF
jgi:hypothetical protein